jgi:hypothetical protein
MGQFFNTRRNAEDVMSGGGEQKKMYLLMKIKVFTNFISVLFLKCIYWFPLVDYLLGVTEIQYSSLRTDSVDIIEQCFPAFF